MAAIGMTGCGSDDSLTAKEEAAQVVGSMREAMREGDAVEACSYMTKTGKRFLRSAPGLKAEGESCEAAVARLARRISARQLEFDKEDVVTPEEIELNDDGTASANSDYRGAMGLRLVDGEWKVDVPFFLD